MRDDFEFHGKGAFDVAPEHSQQDGVFYTDQMTVQPLPRDSLDRQAWKPTWQERGWLVHNPLVSLQQFTSSFRGFHSPLCRVSF